MGRTMFSACLALAVVMPTTLLAGSSVDEQEMAQSIGSQLKASGQLHNYRIGVKYHDGVAWLSGAVASDQQMSTAVRLTRQMRGIQQVVNNLAISEASPSASNSGDLELGQSLEQASQQSRQIRSASLSSRRSASPHPTYSSSRQATEIQPTRPMPRNNMPLPMGARPVRQAVAENYGPMSAQYAANGMAPGRAMGQGPMPTGYVPGGQARAVSYDNAQMPGYAWPTYASYPNYAALTYPQQYSPTAWPYIGPFYPYPQVPLGWRKVALEWDDGWWFLDFSDCGSNH
jgi:BON domain